MSSSGTASTGLVFDEAAFRQKIAYPLVASNLQGVYTSPAPPDGFNPNTAGAADMIKNGLLWGRPGPNDNPALIEAWNKAFSRQWPAADRVAPTFEQQPGKTHHLRKPLVKQKDGSFVGGVWSGAGIIGGGPWTGVIGFWNIPTVSKAPQPGTPGWDSSSWIGIDGFNISNDVLQVGIQQSVSASGTPAYVAWYEWFVPPPATVPPGTPVDSNGYPLSWVGPTGKYKYIYQANFSIPVTAGQQVYCSVQYVGKTAGYIYFANQTTGQHTSITVAPPPGAAFNGDTVEWIMEDPNGGEPGTALAKFTPVAFTSAIACSGSILATPPATIGNPDAGSTTNIETSNGTLLTKTSVGSFSVTVDFV